MKCIKCGEDTDILIKVDIDIKGIPVCQKCKKEIKLSLYLFAMGHIS